MHSLRGYCLSAALPPSIGRGTCRQWTMKWSRVCALDHFIVHLRHVMRI